MGDTDSFWLCSICGYFPGNRANWCNAGCGSDYRSMTKVGTAEALTYADGQIEKQRQWCRRANAESRQARATLDRIREWAERPTPLTYGDPPELRAEVLALLDPEKGNDGVREARP